MTQLQVVSQEENNYDRQPYKAFNVEQKTQKRLAMVDTEGHVMALLPYTRFADAFCYSPHTLWLVFGDTFFRIEGKHLPGQMLRLLQDDRVKTLNCYSRERFEPVEEDEIVIFNITRHNMEEFMQTEGQ